MDILYIGNPFNEGNYDTNGSCMSKTCGDHLCDVFDCTGSYSCGIDTCGAVTENYDDSELSE